MSARSILVLIIVILLTIVIMQNQDPADFTLLFIQLHIPKLVVMTTMSAVGLILGLLVSLPKSKRQHHSYPHDESGNDAPRSGTLSDEDRDYISEP